MLHLFVKVNNNKNCNSKPTGRRRRGREGVARFSEGDGGEGGVLVSSLILLTGKQKLETRKMSPRAPTMTLSGELRQWVSTFMSHQPERERELDGWMENKLVIFLFGIPLGITLAASW